MTDTETALAPSPSAVSRSGEKNLTLKEKPGEERMTPAEKATVVLVALGPETASRLLAEVGEQRLRRFARIVKDLREISPEAVERVIAEFLHKIEDSRSIGGGADEARRFLGEVLDQNEVNQIMGDLDIKGRSVWSLLGDIDDARIAVWLRTEHPQVAAIALARLNSVKAAKVLEMFDQEMADDIIVRMGPAASADAAVAERIGKVIARDFLPVALNRRGKQEPADLIASVINHVSGPSRDRLLDAMTNAAPKLAEAVRKVMFTFDHIPQRINPRDVGAITKTVEEETLLRAMKAAGEQHKTTEFILGNISKRLAERLREDMVALPDATRKEGEAAQAEVVAAVIELRDSGAIKIIVPEEDE